MHVLEVGLKEITSLIELARLTRKIESCCMAWEVVKEAMEKPALKADIVQTMQTHAREEGHAYTVEECAARVDELARLPAPYRMTADGKLYCFCANMRHTAFHEIEIESEEIRKALAEFVTSGQTTGPTDAEWEAALEGIATGTPVESVRVTAPAPNTRQ